jgi:hypothetical protein
MSEARVVTIIPREEAMFDEWMGGKTKQQVADEFHLPLEVMERVVKTHAIPIDLSGRMELQHRRINRIAQVIDRLWEEVKQGDPKHRHHALLLLERFDARLDALNGPQSITRLDAPAAELAAKRETSTDRIEAAMDAVIAECRKHQEPEGVEQGVDEPLPL